MKSYGWTWIVDDWVAVGKITSDGEDDTCWDGNDDRIGLTVLLGLLIGAVVDRAIWG